MRPGVRAQHHIQQRTRAEGSELSPCRAGFRRSWQVFRRQHTSNVSRTDSGRRQREHGPDRHRVFGSAAAEVSDHGIGEAVHLQGASRRHGDGLQDRSLAGPVLPDQHRPHTRRAISEDARKLQPADQLYVLDRDFSKIHSVLSDTQRVDFTPIHHRPRATLAIVCANGVRPGRLSSRAATPDRSRRRGHRCASRRPGAAFRATRAPARRSRSVPATLARSRWPRRRRRA